METRRRCHRRHLCRRHRHRRRRGDRPLPRQLQSPPSPESCGHKYITMVKKKLGVIGAKGSGKVRFFHPSEHIRAQWPNEHQKIRIADVLLVRKAMHKVNRLEKLCYECRITEIDNGVIFHITCKKFRVETVGATPFDDEVVVIAQIAPQETGPVTVATAGDRLSVHNVAPNICGVLAEEIAELRQQGIEVNDDNDPAPENAI